MGVLKTETVLVAGVIVAGAALFYWKWGGSDHLAHDIGYDIGAAAVDAVDGVVSGVALNVGDAVGIPRTDKTACQAAIDEGRTWDASFACPASTWIKSLF